MTAALDGVLRHMTDSQLLAELHKRKKLTKIQVDDGSVELIDYMGDDLSVANAARVSFAKHKEVFDKKDEGLIRYLAEHKHMSPFRHVQFSFRLEVSEVLCRQLYKHQIGCAYTSGEFREAATVWNEQSGRYIELAEEFHHPEQFRKQSPSNKQASLENEWIEDQFSAKETYTHALKETYKAYEKLLELGVCKEQARMVLPVSFMNKLIWTASLEAVVNFIKLRDHDGAQLEIRKLARAVKTLIEPITPVSLGALLP